ncbi:hypothetical protein [Bradyrhizobium sp. UFLA05-112]
MKKCLYAPIIVILSVGAAGAETASERCETTGVANVTTLPVNADKMWHQSDAPGVIWFKLPKGTHIDLFASYTDKQSVRWAWGSAEYNSVIVSGWVKHSSLNCNLN